MKKKVLVLLVVAILAITPAMAARSTRGTSDDGAVGVGLNLGTNSGLALKFGMGKFDIFANVGFNILNGTGLGADVGLSYEVYDIDLGGAHHMPVTVGFMAPISFNWASSFSIHIAALAQAGLEYQIPDTGWLFYLRAGLGADFRIIGDSDKFVKFTGAGGIGAMYVF